MVYLWVRLSLTKPFSEQCSQANLARGEELPCVNLTKLLIPFFPIVGNVAGKGDEVHLCLVGWS